MKHKNRAILLYICFVKIIVYFADWLYQKLQRKLLLYCRWNGKHFAHKAELKYNKHPKNSNSCVKLCILLNSYATFTFAEYVFNWMSSSDNSHITKSFTEAEEDARTKKSFFPKKG
jgi:hypothetical protein